jgi:hypothetical protein
VANISQIKKKNHTVVAAAPSFVDSIEILWDSPFYDTNYDIDFSVEILTQSDQVTTGFGASINVLSVTNVTPRGFTAKVECYSAVAGDKWVIHAIASHR